jgi:hypothetical protein
MNDIKEARAQLHRFYALTTQLKVQLQALDETLPFARVEIQEADPPGDIEAIAFLVLMDATTSGRKTRRQSWRKSRPSLTPKPSSATCSTNRPNGASICSPPTR